MVARTRRYATIAGLLLVISGAVGACSSSSDSSALRAGGDGSGTSEPRGALVELEDEARAFDSAYSADASVAQASSEFGGGGGSVADIPPIGPTVIKTADLKVSMAKSKIQDSLDDAIAIASASGGFVVSSSTSGEGTDRASLVLRVPSDRFESALEDLAALGKVETRSVGGQDVSQEFVDLEARLRNASAQEAVLLRLMDEAVNVSDTIRVQRELQGVQLEIERLKGRLNFLEDQATLSTISLSLVDSGAPVPTENGPFERAWQTAVDTFVAVVSGVIVGAGFVVPIALMLGLIYVIFAPLVKKLRPRFEP